MSSMQRTDQDGKLHKIGTNAHGNEASAGYYVVTRDGHVVLQRPDAPLKDRQRLATREDIERKRDEEQDRQEAERAAAEPRPTFTDSTVDSDPAPVASPASKSSP